MNERINANFRVSQLKTLLNAELPSHLGGGVYRYFFKRLFDIFFVLIMALPAMVMLLPVMVLIALDGKSPLYLQKRVGKNGRLFRMWKLRSMVADAEHVLEGYLALNPEARREWDHSQKLKDDPRITPIGHFIRKSSLDELPQLVNVLLGDMSIVGPRPMMACQKPLYPGKAYYEMRPGITGFWQVSERNESSFRERAIYDARYDQQMSLSTDIVVLAATVRVVLKGTGY